jgi:hypothetical protein
MAHTKKFVVHKETRDIIREVNMDETPVLQSHEDVVHISYSGHQPALPKE